MSRMIFSGVTYWNLDFIERIEWHKEHQCHEAVTTGGHRFRSDDPPLIIEHLIPCQNSYICVRTCDDNGKLTAYDTPVIAFALMLDNEILPVLIDNLLPEKSGEWGLREKNCAVVWVPFEGMYDDTVAWLARLKASKTAVKD